MRTDHVDMHTLVCTHMQFMHEQDFDIHVVPQIFEKLGGGGVIDV